VTFRELSLESFYEGWGDEITQSALMPILRETVRYDRISSYFSIESLLAISEGIESIWRRNGKMRLIMGLHDLNSEILAAHDDSREENLEETLAAIKARVLSRVSRLEDEIARNKIHVFASMLKEGFLSLKIAAHPSGPGEAIFHNKRFIFKDGSGNTITASSGMNETVRGLTRNYDDLTLQRSWMDSGNQLQLHVESFERLWEGQRPDLIIRDIGDDFALELEAQTRPVTQDIPPSNPDAVVERLAGLIRDSNEYFFHSMSQVALFPHQERVVQEALSELPVRKMLADEVGLGKTLEAGAILSFLSTRLAATRICIACPQGLMRQWRDEMSGHFGLDFWLWDSSTNEYESPTGKRFAPRNGMPFGSEIPEKVIVSSHLLRTKRQRSHIDSLSDLAFDVFVLDEAHAARLTQDSSGRITKTKLWSVAKTISEASTHTLLLTATPMQMSFIELFGQLSLLGLTGAWTNADSFQMSVEALGGLSTETSLEECNTLAKLLVESAQGQLASVDFEARERIFLDALTAATNTFDRSILVNQNLELAYDVLLKVHPAHKLVIRNTRDSLVAMGYVFPERIHTAPELSAHSGLRGYFRELESYLRNGYGRVEKATSPDKSWSAGFAASGYYQRLASSLVASRTTLLRRLRRIQELSEEIERFGRLNVNSAALTEEDDFSDFEVSEEFDSAVIADLESPQRVRQVLHAAQIESVALQSLVATLDNISPDLGDIDPKFAAALKGIAEHSSTAPVLVFSRYTDTLEGFLRYLERAYLPSQKIGYGYYTGKEVWLDYEGARLPASKNEVVQALFEGKISLLLCSDAASEGLNLQAAATIINIDVPWNPARLEQRIGRVDRLGQRQPTVQIINLWYPDSVEAKIYNRLLTRKDQLELAVGKYPALVAQSIAEAVSHRLGFDSDSPDLNGLELFRDRVQEEALSRLWSHDTPGLTQSRDVRGKAYVYFQKAPETASLMEDLVVEEGSPRSFCILHKSLMPWWTSLDALVPSASVDGLYGFCIENRLARFVVLEGDSAHLLRNEALSEVIAIQLGLVELTAVEAFIELSVQKNTSGFARIASRIQAEARLPMRQDSTSSETDFQLIALPRGRRSLGDSSEEH
jgi:hypothetical protein